MLEIAKTVAVVMLLVLGALVALIFWILCRAKRDEFDTRGKPEEPADRCETCVRYDECQGVDENCPVRR